MGGPAFFDGDKVAYITCYLFELGEETLGVTNGGFHGRFNELNLVNHTKVLQACGKSGHAVFFAGDGDFSAEACKGSRDEKCPGRAIGLGGGRGSGWDVKSGENNNACPFCE